jgi:predicted branched-subunit amino acid permease
MSAENTGAKWPDQRGSIIRDGLGVGLATGVYGISFGAVSVASGLSVAQTCALSLLMFTGASQFAFVGIIAAGGPWAAIVTAWLLGVRNTIYGLNLATLLKLGQPWRSASAHLVIDESTAMALTRGITAEARTGFFSTGLGVFVFWNLATWFGAVAGSEFANPRELGLDAAVGGAFLALLWPRLNSRSHGRVALTSAVVALACLPLVPPGMAVLIAGAVCLLMGALTEPEIDAKNVPTSAADSDPGISSGVSS